MFPSKRTRLIAAPLLVAWLTTAAVPQTAHASNWMDSWGASAVGQGAGTFEGQKRGYMNAGSYGMRWRPGGNDNLMNIELPSFSGGCGGINVFGGGMSFLNFDRLVENLQGMLMNAPAIAFDLALQVLSEAASNALGKFRGIIDTLNSTQMDSCAATKTLLTEAWKSGTPSNLHTVKGAGASLREWAIGKGDETDDSSLQEQQEAGGLNKILDGAAEIARTLKCNAATEIIKEGSVLKNMGDTLSMDSSWLDMMRGLVGDIYIHKETELFKVEVDAPCVQNGPVRSIKDAQENMVWARGVRANSSSSPPACYRIPETSSSNLQAVATANLTALAASLKSAGPIDDTVKAYIDQVPMAVYPILKTAVATGADEAVVYTMAEFVARAQAMQMMRDLLGQSQYIIYKVGEAISKSGPENGGKSIECPIADRVEITGSGTKELLDRIQVRLNQARDEYMIAGTELQSQLNILNHYQGQIDRQQADIKRVLNKDITRRVR